VTIVSGASTRASEFRIEDVSVKNVDLGRLDETHVGSSNLKILPDSSHFHLLRLLQISPGLISTTAISTRQAWQQTSWLENMEESRSTHFTGSYYDIWRYIEPPVVASLYRFTERALAPALARLSTMQIHTGALLRP